MGDALPGVDLFEGNPGNKVNAQEAFGKGKHVIFAIPGAFTPTCQNVSTCMYINHLQTKLLNRSFVKQ